MVTKVEAARIAAAAGIQVVLTSAVHAAEALGGGDTGTYFHPTGRRSADRLLWLQHASTPQGSLTLDDGAVRAVVEGRKSLLPAGIAGVEGDFSAGDPVELRDREGHAVARGLVNFDAKEIPFWWAAPPANSRGNWAPGTNARSYTGTISWSCIRNAPKRRPSVVDVPRNRPAIRDGLLNFVAGTNSARTRAVRV